MNKTNDMIKKYGLDFIKVLEFGAIKYDADGWLERDGKKMDKKSQVKSISSHTAEYFSGRTTDLESELHPLLHVMSRAFMGYVRHMEEIPTDDYPTE